MLHLRTIKKNTLSYFFFLFPLSYFFSLPVKRILNKPQIFRSDLRTDVNASQLRAGRSLQIKVQRSRHKNLYDVNHQLKVRSTAGCSGYEDNNLPETNIK